MEWSLHLFLFPPSLLLCLTTGPVSHQWDLSSGGGGQCLTSVSVQRDVATNCVFFDFIDRRRINGDQEWEPLTFRVALFLFSNPGNL